MVLKQIKSKIPWLNPFRTIVIIILGILAMFIIIPFWNNLGKFLIIGIFTIIGAGSFFYRRQIELRIGIEFIFPFTIIVAIAYGVESALWYGNFTTFCAELVGGKVDERIFMNFVSISVAALVANPIWSFTNHNLFLTGFLANLCYHAAFLCGLLVFAGNPMKTVIFIATNILWILLFFLRIAPIFSFLFAR